MAYDMTDEEARKVLDVAPGWIGWNNKLDQPAWSAYSGFAPDVSLDGVFTARQLQALLHFAPKEGL